MQAYELKRPFLMLFPCFVSNYTAIIAIFQIVRIKLIQLINFSGRWTKNRHTLMFLKNISNFLGPEIFFKRSLNRDTSFGSVFMAQK